MFVRLGDLLVQRGSLTPQQRDEVLAAQADQPRPFGVLAEELFGVSPHDVEDSWTMQYAQVAPRIDPRSEDIDPDILGLIERRQAWQFTLIPVRRFGGELQCVTTAPALPRAMRFAGWRLPELCTFALCDTEAMTGGLNTHFPIAGFDAGSIAAIADRYAAAG